MGICGFYHRLLNTCRLHDVATVLILTGNKSIACTMATVSQDSPSTHTVALKLSLQPLMASLTTVIRLGEQTPPSHRAVAHWLFSNGGRYGKGDSQWMNAGAGICHGEMFPLVSDTHNNPTRFFQIWLNLAAVDKMCDPTFVMHWAPDVPKITSSDSKVNVTIYAGTLEGRDRLATPPKSWAADPGHDVGVFHITLQPGGQYSLPASPLGSDCNRMVYVIEGSSLEIGGKVVAKDHSATLDAGLECTLHNPNDTNSEVLVLQGQPIGEPVAKYGPFVMNTQAEIRQAFTDYQETGFGGWPWDQDAVVFPRDKGRFARIDGTETYPPGKDGTNPLDE